MAALASLTLAFGALAAEKWDFLATQRWLLAAERAAQDDVTETICSGLPADSRLAMLDKALTEGAGPDILERIIERYDSTLKERQRLEAVLALNSDNRPERRFGGLFATDGCQAARARGQDWRTLLPPPM